jgi:tetratricopeptide (TPR) repeat protein
MLQPKSILVLLFTVGVMAPDAAVAQETVSDACQTHWEDFSRRYVPSTPGDYEGMLSAWKSVGKECGELPSYHARLGLIYYYLDRPKDAQEAIVSLSASEQRLPLVQLVQLLIDISVVTDGREPTEAELKTLEEKLIAFSTANPREIVGQSMLADVMGGQGRHDIAIALYENALSSIKPTPRAAGIMRNLTVSYEAVGRFQQAYDLAGKALAYDKGLTTDMDFMCATARSQASIGKIGGAQDTLTILALKKPEVESHPRFKAAIEFVKEKSRAAKALGGPIAPAH